MKGPMKLFFVCEYNSSMEVHDHVAVLVVQSYGIRIACTQVVSKLPNPCMKKTENTLQLPQAIFKISFLSNDLCHYNNYNGQCYTSHRISYAVLHAQIQGDHVSGTHDSLHRRRRRSTVAANVTVYAYVVVVLEISIK